MTPTETAYYRAAPLNHRGCRLRLWRRLITGASAMGAVFTLGSSGMMALAPLSGRQAGLQLTFAVAALLGGLALVVSVRAIARQAA